MVMLPPDNERAGALARRTAEVKQKAIDEKSTAKQQLDRHKPTCPACNPKLRFIRPAKRIIVLALNWCQNHLLLAHDAAPLSAPGMRRLQGGPQ